MYFLPGWQADRISFRKTSAVRVVAGGTMFTVFAAQSNTLCHQLNNMKYYNRFYSYREDTVKSVSFKDVFLRMY